MGHRIYVASSWRNRYQPGLVAKLKEEGHLVYDFRNPRAGFAWKQISEEWESWSTEEFRDALRHPYAEAGFAADFDALCTAEVLVLLLPCGRSAHVEAGYFRGLGGPVIVHIPEHQEPELMYKMFNAITADDETLVQLLSLPLEQLEAV